MKSTSFRSLSAVLGVAAVVAALLAAGPRQEMRWYRGNLHTHSLWSDGNDFPEMIVDWYKAAGYEFIALSDHNVLANTERWVENDYVIRRGGRSALKEYRERFGRDWVETRDGEGGKLEVRLRRLDEYRGLFDEDGEFLVLQAEEVTDSFQKKPVHMNATNVAELIRPRHGSSIREVMANNLAAVKEQAKRLDQRIVMHLNHPNFGWGVTAEDLAHVTDERFYEVWNGHPGVRHRGDDIHASVEHMWDIANTIRLGELRAAPLFGVATDDCHNYHNASGSTPGRGWVTVRAAELTPDALLESMENGDFYASSGVELDEIRFEDGVLHVEVAAVEGETYTLDLIGTPVDYERGSEPVLSDDGKELGVTRRYSDDVGKRLQRVVGPRARFEIGSGLLFARVVITSSATMANPVWEGQRKQAWTQPVGWKRHL